MNVSSLKRDPQHVLSAWTTTRDMRVVTKRECKIYIPKRFEEHGLAEVGAETRILGLCAIVVDGANYGVMNVNAMMRIEPTSTNIVIIDEEEYYEFEFEKGATVIPNANLVKQDTLLYSVYNELISKGRVPWYMSYEDLGKLFSTAKYHAGATLAASNSIIEMIIATIARNAKDRSKFYRHSIQNMEEQFKTPPVFIPLKSPIYGPNNTTSKLIGAYFDDSLSSALTNPSEKVEGVEKLLRR